MYLPKEREDGARRCPSLQTRGCLPSPGQVHCLLGTNGQVGLDFDSFSVWSGSTPLTGSGRHQLAMCTRDAVSVLSATEQTPNCSRGKEPTSPIAPGWR